MNVASARNLRSGVFMIPGMHAATAERLFGECLGAAA
jgi:hypothetical protein